MLFRVTERRETIIREYFNVVTYFEAKNKAELIKRIEKKTPSILKDRLYKIEEIKK